MINRQQVISVFEELYDAGEFEGQLLPLCDAACIAVEAKLRKNADETDSALLILAAALLNRRIVSRIADEDAIASFKAGDVTIRKETGERLRNADTDVERALELALPLLRDDGFLFMKC